MYILDILPSSTYIILPISDVDAPAQPWISVHRGPGDDIDNLILIWEEKKKGQNLLSAYVLYLRTNLSQLR